MGKSHAWFAGALAAAVLWTSSPVSAETILLVPQDDRPVSLSYTVDTAEGAGYDVITPPEYMISGKNYHGEPDLIWNWVKENANRADIMVLSTDTLIYGGLVDSRKHDLPTSTLLKRTKDLRALHESNPNVPIYAFGTVMRSPRASGGGVEPAYYDTFGPTIFQIAALQDKLDAGQLSTDEQAQLIQLQAQVPIEYLQDWFTRRQKNMEVNRALIDETRAGVFRYFALGHDDTSTLSQSALESRYLKAYSKGLSDKVYGSFPGADQLALLLIARAHVDINNLQPSFEVIYPLGGAGDTVPHYEDQSVAKTIAEHVLAVGGTMVTKGQPDILLAVNTPLGTVTGESEAFENFPMISASTNAFLDQIEASINKKVAVSVADIAYSNGADNTFVYGLYKRGLLYKVDAYNGWNTASNTVGYAIAQGVLGKNMQTQEHRNMLTQQYLDNWAYQANIRKDIYRMQEDIRVDNVRYTGTLNEKLEAYMGERIQDFAEKYLEINPRTVEARFPWGRLFETEIIVHDQPVAPLQKELRLQREAEAKAKAEAEAKAKAEAEAKAKAEAAAKAKGTNEPTSAGDVPVTKEQ
ncbi:DUF4127 family protein [uncultured Veillonella sp.]|uniref:DUF4127 family protein n=1 Tax=uncultured Veillonella sp. TaxID=159268 RepID=UPI0025DEE0E2|nr:DUF4127 family protein [uncultured Veillonella sp.]MDY3974700.1 DUF4127 family protein [Veillonella caviae]